MVKVIALSVLRVILYNGNLKGLISTRSAISGIKYALIVILLVIIDLVIPEKRLHIRQLEEMVHAWKGSRNPTLSPSPQKNFLVLMFKYEYCGLSANGVLCSQCSQCSHHSRYALAAASIMLGRATLRRH